MPLRALMLCGCHSANLHMCYRDASLRHFVTCDHLNMTLCPQTPRVRTRRRAGVRHRAATARVTSRACTPTTGACPAVRTKTGCHQKVSAPATGPAKTTAWAHSPNRWPSRSLMCRKSACSPRSLLRVLHGAVVLLADCLPSVPW